VDDVEARLGDALAFLRARSALAPRVGLTLGSGLGDVVDAVEQATVVETAAIPHWPPSTVEGHFGRLAVGTWCGVPVVILAGRSHRYEGYSLDRVTFGVRVMHALGVQTLIFTNAVGAIHPELRPGDLVLASGHLNFIGKRGLLTPAERAERRVGRRVANPYDPALADTLIAAALEAGVRLDRGVLMGGHGPSYETAAEVRMASALGADVVCMSTVHEVTLGAELGCACASISCVTNRATGLTDEIITHDDVKVHAARGAVKIRAILEAWLAKQ
jgi:purine-nucleoside phosphorylase